MFSQKISFLNRGSLDCDLENALNDLVKQVRQTGKAGTLTLNLKVKMFNKQNDEMVVVSPSISVKAPKPNDYDNVMFVDQTGQLVRDNPRQNRLDLHEVPTSKAINE